MERSLWYIIDQNFTLAAPTEPHVREKVQGRPLRPLTGPYHITSPMGSADTWHLLRYVLAMSA